MLWGVVTGMVQCGVVLRWADVHTDDAPRKVAEAFRGAVRWGGRRVEVRGCATRPQVRSIKPCSPSATCVATKQMEQSGEQPRKGKAKRSIDCPQGRPFIVCHDKQQVASSAGASPSPRPRPSQGRGSKRVVAGNQSPRGGEGKWINRSEQVGVDDMAGIISMAKFGRWCLLLWQ